MTRINRQTNYFREINALQRRVGDLERQLNHNYEKQEDDKVTIGSGYEVTKNKENDIVNYVETPNAMYPTVAAVWRYVATQVSGATIMKPAIMNAAPILTIPDDVSFVALGGSGTIDTITAWGGTGSKFIILLFTANISVSTAGNLKITANPLANNANDIMSFVSSGSNWYQVSRAANL